jgi:ABC-2 type transport system permease protein
MIYKIAHKEFVEILRDKRFFVSALIVGGLLLTSLALGWRHNAEVRRQHEAAQAATEQQWLNQGEKAPHSAAHFGVYAFKLSLPLAFVDRGVEAFTGVAVWLEAHKQNDFRYRPAQDQTILARFSELTAAAVLQILLPLLIILLAFSAFAGERESGTLRQVLSLGVAPAKLALGKVLGITGVLSLLLIPAVIVGIIALSLTSETPFDAARIALMTLGYLLYLGVFLFVALAVSARVSSSGAALIILLGIWIFGCLIAPRAATDIARRAYPTPSALEFSQAVEADLKNGTDGHNPADKRLAALKTATMQQYGVARLEDLPVNFDGIALQAGEDFGNQIFDKHYGNLWNAFEQQEKVRQISAIAAPQLAVASLSRGLAGTDFAQHRDFAVSAENHRRTLIQVINKDVMHNARYGDRNYIANANLWAQVPAFSYAPPSVIQILREQIGGIAVLLAWFAGSILLLFLATRTMKVQ